MSPADDPAPRPGAGPGPGSGRTGGRRPRERAPKKQANTDLRPRVVSALVLIVLSVLFTWVGGTLYTIAICTIGALLYYEWTRMTLLPTQAFSVRFCAVLFAVAVFLLLLREIGWAFAVAAAGSVVLAVIVNRRLVAVASLTRAKWAIAGLFYALVATVSLVVVRLAHLERAEASWEADRGLVLMAYLLAVVWATDIFAYFVGRRFGGPKLLPVVSPKKTWSGSLGGVAAAAVVGAAFGYAPVGFDLLTGLLLAIVLSVVAQAGDLFESWLKRRNRVKDSSRLIPGHGGFMDRVDGLVAAAVPLAIFVALTS